MTSPTGVTQKSEKHRARDPAKGKREAQDGLDTGFRRDKICRMKKVALMLAGSIFLFIAGAKAQAQSPVPPPGPAGPALAPAQLDQLIGPIALYPDPLIAEILPAATFPSEIVVADRYINQGGDVNQVAEQGWDPSIQALAHYPTVLKWMDDNLAWTTQLGQAFQNQQADVMDSVQRLRAQAQSLGNLPSTAQESVSTDDGAIEIEPTDPDEMYVPTYQPDAIYYQSGVYCTFPFALPVGLWLVHDWNWRNHGLVFWGPGHPRPDGWWHETPGQRHSFIARNQMPVWHGGARGDGGERGGWARGFEEPISRSYAPRQAGPEITVIHSAPTTVRSVPAFRGAASAPVERHEEVRSEPAHGSFVGGQSGREAEQSSSRGQSSRASMGGGGGGGGGGKHR
jgi:hypothetical protein